MKRSIDTAWLMHPRQICGIKTSLSNRWYQRVCLHTQFLLFKQNWRSHDILCFNTLLLTPLQVHVNRYRPKAPFKISDTKWRLFLWRYCWLFMTFISLQTLWIKIRPCKTLSRPGAVLIKLFESEIKFMLKLQIRQILAMSKPDLSRVGAC